MAKWLGTLQRDILYRDRIKTIKKLKRLLEREKIFLGYDQERNEFALVYRGQATEKGPERFAVSMTPEKLGLVITWMLENQKQERRVRKCKTKKVK